MLSFESSDPKLRVGRFRFRGLDGDFWVPSSDYGGQEVRRMKKMVKFAAGKTF